VIAFEWNSRDVPFARGGGAAEKALARALRLAGNQALRVMAEESESHVTGRKVIDRDRVKAGLDLIFPGSKDVIASLVWTERVSGEAMPLSRFPFIAARVLRVRVNQASGFKAIKGAFARRLGSGHLGIFRRKGRERLPIQELWTTRISDAMGDDGAVDRVQGKAMERFSSAFERGLGREMDKLRRKGDL
jgi:hypothetical protein